MTGRIEVVDPNPRALRPFGEEQPDIDVHRVLLDTALSEIELVMTGTFLWAIRASSTNALMEIGFNTQRNSKFPVQQGLVLEGVHFSRMFIDAAAQVGEWIELLSVKSTARRIRAVNAAVTLGTVVVSSISAPLIAPDTITSVADIACLTAAKTVLSAVNIARRELIIRSAIANTGNVKVADHTNVGAARGISLAPGETQIWATSAAISARNDSGATQTIEVVEIEET